VKIGQAPYPLRTLISSSVNIEYSPHFVSYQGFKWGNRLSIYCGMATDPQLKTAIFVVLFTRPFQNAVFFPSYQKKSLLQNSYLEMIHNSNKFFYSDLSAQIEWTAANGKARRKMGRNSRWQQGNLRRHVTIQILELKMYIRANNLCYPERPTRWATKKEPNVEVKSTGCEFWLHRFDSQLSDD
jgi:hypothetical protein